MRTMAITDDAYQSICDTMPVGFKKYEWISALVIEGARQYKKQGFAVDQKPCIEE